MLAMLILLPIALGLLGLTFVFTLYILKTLRDGKFPVKRTNRMIERRHNPGEFWFTIVLMIVCVIPAYGLGLQLLLLALQGEG